jgi:ubiquinone/menaquinone biosynthesis C-methylase UbiE
MDDFNTHWEQNISLEIPISKILIASKFLQPLFSHPQMNNMLILDAGCGDGVHAQVIMNDRNKIPNSTYIGLDISAAPLRMAQRRLPENLYIQGDIGDLPFEDNIFNIVFSFGVLAYTTDPLSSFSELYRVTRPGGYIGIWIYPHIGGIGGFLFSSVRMLCQKLGPIGSRIIADLIVPFLSVLPTTSRVSLKNASWRQCREVVLINIAPKLLIFPNSSEVIEWFMKKNMEIIFQDENNPITIWGVK